jgi:hypothetical protein
VKYIIPAFLAFVFGLLLWQIQKDKILLDYEVVESAPFPRETGTGQYFVVRLRNAGSKEIRDIELSITFKSGSIESISFSEPRIVTDVTKSARELKGRIPLLNPGESVASTITLVTIEGVAAPRVIARAPGVTAIPRTDDVTSRQCRFVFGILIGSALILALLSIYNSYRASKLSKSMPKIEEFNEVSVKLEKTKNDLQLQLEERKKEMEALFQEREKKYKAVLQEQEKERIEIEQGKPRTEQLIFAIFNKAGLGHRFADLVGSAEGVSYWKTGLFLINFFLVDKDNRDKYIKAAEMLVEISERHHHRSDSIYICLARWNCSEGIRRRQLIGWGNLRRRHRLCIIILLLRIQHMT